MAREDLGNALRRGNHGRLGRLIAVEGARAWAARQNSRGEGRTDHDRYASAGAQRELVQPRLIEQGIGHGHQKEVDRPALQEPRDHADDVDAGTDRRNLAGGLEVGERAVAAAASSCSSRAATPSSDLWKCGSRSWIKSASMRLRPRRARLIS